MTHTHTEINAPSVLFFGKHNCQYSQQTYEHLKHLGFNVTAILSKNRQEKLPEDIGWWEGDYIICFRSYFVLPKSLLNRAKVAAINFHPAPAEYPGSGCLNWALYDNAKIYGTTAHIMNEKIDNGAIIECRRFPVLPQDNVRTLLARAHLKTYDLIIDITTGLALEGKIFLDKKLTESKNENWAGNARKMYEIDKLQIVNPTCSEEELKKVIRATYTPDFPPEIHLHGYKFVLKL
jgi:methionyl-tRNA formyltransferase